LLAQRWHLARTWRRPRSEWRWVVGRGGGALNAFLTVWRCRQVAVKREKVQRIRREKAAAATRKAAERKQRAAQVAADKRERERGQTIARARQAEKIASAKARRCVLHSMIDVRCQSAASSAHHCPLRAAVWC
jgi:hypothetical protein